MNFGATKTKLDEKQYLTKEEFASDVNLVFANCRSLILQLPIPPFALTLLRST